MMPSVDLLRAIEQMLEETFHLSDWSISRPADGQQKECYIAKTATLAVFLKFDGRTPGGVLQRLGELGVAPRVLRTGSLEGRPYVLQDYVVGKHPVWRWFADHLPLLAQVTRRYHTDIQLKQFLTGSISREYHEQVAFELAALEAQMTSLRTGPQCVMTLSSVFADLKSQANQLHPVSLTPVHNDPNGANILLRDGKMVFVDWDDMLLSDPMRDVTMVRLVCSLGPLASLFQGRWPSPRSASSNPSVLVVCTSLICQCALYNSILRTGNCDMKHSLTCAGAYGYEI